MAHQADRAVVYARAQVRHAGFNRTNAVGDTCDIAFGGRHAVGDTRDIAFGGRHAVGDTRDAAFRSSNTLICIVKLAAVNSICRILGNSTIG